MFYITGHTCGEACWHAREEVCRCSCGGKNHGILYTNDGKQPKRTRRIDGKFYELVAIIPYPAKGECFNDSFKKVRQAENETLAERFPGISLYAYGQWCREKTSPVVSRKVSPSQAKWSECQALDTKPMYMVWSQPVGSKYLRYDASHKAQYITHDATDHLERCIDAREHLPAGSTL